MYGGKSSLLQSYGPEGYILSDEILHIIYIINIM